MKKAVILIGAAIAMSSLLNLGTIRKKEQPILKTQTDPISYKQKMEETKDGPKGPPMPSFNLFPRERFMTDSSVAESKEEDLPTGVSGEEKVSEVDVAPPDEQSSEDWWSDESEDPGNESEETANPEVEEEP